MRCLLAFLLFTACATPVETVGGPPEGVANLHLGEQARFGALTVTPVQVEEDSRCPASVQCIQAGTVRLSVRILNGRGERTEVLQLDTPRDLGNGSWIALAAACPYPRVPGPIAGHTYRFMLAVAVGRPPAPLDVAC